MGISLSHCAVLKSGALGVHKQGTTKGRLAGGKVLLAVGGGPDKMSHLINRTASFLR